MATPTSPEGRFRTAQRPSCATTHWRESSTRTTGGLGRNRLRPTFKFRAGNADTSASLGPVGSKPLTDPRIGRGGSGERWYARGSRTREVSRERTRIPTRRGRSPDHSRTTHQARGASNKSIAEPPCPGRMGRFPHPSRPAIAENSTKPDLWHGPCTRKDVRLESGLPGTFERSGHPHRRSTPDDAPCLETRPDRDLSSASGHGLAQPGAAGVRPAAVRE